MGLRYSLLEEESQVLLNFFDHHKLYLSSSWRQLWQGCALVVVLHPLCIWTHVAQGQERVGSLAKFSWENGPAPATSRARASRDVPWVLQWKRPLAEGSHGLGSEMLCDVPHCNLKGKPSEGFFFYFIFFLFGFKKCLHKKTGSRGKSKRFLTCLFSVIKLWE